VKGGVIMAKAKVANKATAAVDAYIKQ